MGQRGKNNYLNDRPSPYVICFYALRKIGVKNQNVPITVYNIRLIEHYEEQEQTIYLFIYMSLSLILITIYGVIKVVF